MIKVLAFDRWYVCGDYDISRFNAFLTKNGYDYKKEENYYKKYKWDFDRAKMSEKQFRDGLKKTIWFNGSIETLKQNNAKNLVIDWRLLEYIQKINKKYTTILWSNMDKTSINQIEKEVSLKKFFKKIYFSWNLKKWKTEENVIKNICKNHKCLPWEILFIDDTPEVISTIKKLWYQWILYTGLEQFKKDFRKYQ